MYKELVVNVTEQETRVALLEDGNIVELFVERGDDTNINGNIYKGRVQRVLPGMQAAFVDIGLNQAAFIYVDDVQKKQNIGENEAPYSENGNKEFAPDNTGRQIPIEELLREGQEIMVQVVKSPIGTKGARITTYISLPGRYLVLMPNVDHIGISKRIASEDERTRLRDLISDKREIPYGYIFRTAGEGIAEEQLKREMDLLVNSWENIKKRYRSFSAPYRLHRDLTVTFRAIRDLLTHEADRLTIDNKFGFDSVNNFIRKIMPELKVKVEYYDRSEPIFEAFSLEGDISRALKKKVWLKCGGYIVIEQTEALTSIDVNTGRYVGKHNFEETIFKTNLEAIREISAQVRLRNIGGIIILDFIDMENLENRERVFETLKESFKQDKCRTNILPMSEIGLVQMTRKRVRKSLTRMLCEECPICYGDGYTISKTTISQKIYREIHRHARDMMGDIFTLKVSEEMADYLHRDEISTISAIEYRLGKKIEIYPIRRFHREEFELTEKFK
ncbi:Rne/Rng family ribonuclease [Desulfoluna spongiiphila]|uniref:Ribonuclease G n=1 Tax=Desulfoluna spongiiphila TaxID=419481 RepID=A0A1G5J5W1_9BACT|nr:Rne/Rng family ribonuclease [Desulfoluna spongiiphila]SCY83672.1 RNAse G [Desulfoluna spongiiphila]VVS92977.1 ribonuclease e/g [Desulfoluna spongiiphila]